jgi:hypothetical protein
MFLMANALGDPEPTRSTLSTIATLQHKAGNARPIHPQVYTSGTRRRALQQGVVRTLTADTTRPIRFHLDFRSLEEAHAPPYSACFHAGDWFRRGLPPAQSPPSEPTCHAGAGTDCWGKCEAKDVITPAGRAMMKAVVAQVVGEEASQLLSVIPVAGNLTFEVSTSHYARVLALNGIPDRGPSCAADCSILSGSAVDPLYCTRGVESDVVLSITKPPGLNGVAGTGSSCASDQAGRPLWLTFAWHSSVVELGDKSLDHNVEKLRGLVLHEVLHGLGFSNTMFRDARTSTGARKRLLKLQRVTDNDGAIDEVWHFTHGRAYDLAAAYFDCDPVNGSWAGLPLMGLPEQGRASHWETRIMRDDVMSYGHQSAVSAITMAAMEDLGFYLANYSAAQCLSWGYHQGCAFVTTRCGDMRHDRSEKVASSAECRGDPYWRRSLDPYNLDRKCARGADPCSSASDSGYEPISGSSGAGRCDGQCSRQVGRVRQDCVVGPSAEIEAGFLGDIYSGLHQAALDWQVWLIPCIMLSVGCMALSIVRSVVCPANKRARTMALLIGWLVQLVALAILGCSIYVLSEFDGFVAFVSKQTVITLAGSAGGCSFFFSLTLYGVYKTTASFATSRSGCCFSSPSRRWWRRSSSPTGYGLPTTSRPTPSTPLQAPRWRRTCRQSTCFSQRNLRCHWPWWRALSAQPTSSAAATPRSMCSMGSLLTRPHPPLTAAAARPRAVSTRAAAR